MGVLKGSEVSGPRIAGIFGMDTSPMMPVDLSVPRWNYFGRAYLHPELNWPYWLLSSSFRLLQSAWLQFHPSQANRLRRRDRWMMMREVWKCRDYGGRRLHREGRREEGRIGLHPASVAFHRLGHLNQAHILQSINCQGLTIVINFVHTCFTTCQCGPEGRGDDLDRVFKTDRVSFRMRGCYVFVGARTKVVVLGGEDGFDGVW